MAGPGGKRAGAGRPKGSKNKGLSRAKKIFQSQSDKAINYMLDLLDDTQAPAAVRLSAAKTIIERAWGRVQVEPEDQLDEGLQLDDDQYAKKVRQNLTKEEYDFLIRINKKLEQAPGEE